MKKYAYISKVVSQIKNRKVQNSIERELSCHIDDLTEFYIGQGFTPAEAEEKAVGDMGDADEISGKFGKLYEVNTFAEILATLVYGIAAVFLWGSVNAMFSLITYAVVINSYDIQITFYDENASRTPIILSLLVISLLNYLFVLLFYIIGKRCEIVLSPVKGAILFLLPHIVLMVMFYIAYESTWWLISGLNWWTTCLIYAFGDKVGFLNGLDESVAWNIALTFIPYLAALAGMMKTKFKGE